MSLYPLEEMRYLNLTDPQAETFAEARGEFGELPITSGRQRKAKNVSLLEGTSQQLAYVAFMHFDSASRRGFDSPAT
jgi:hypothetical protein